MDAHKSHSEENMILPRTKQTHHNLNHVVTCDIGNLAIISSIISDIFITMT